MTAHITGWRDLRGTCKTCDQRADIYVTTHDPSARLFKDGAAYFCVAHSPIDMSAEDHRWKDIASSPPQ